MLLNFYPILLLLAATYASDEDLELYEPPPLAPRETWSARSPRRPLPKITPHAKEVVIQHTGGEECATPGECVKRVSDIQAFHMDTLDMEDISFNFLIGGDGIVYVGRGWYNELENTYDQSTLEIAFVGSFHSVLPNLKQLEAFDQLIEMGVSLKLICTDYVLVGQCQLEVSSSPGQALLDFYSSTSTHFNHSLPSQCTEYDYDLNIDDI